MEIFKPFLFVFSMLASYEAGEASSRIRLSYKYFLVDLSSFVRR